MYDIVFRRGNVFDGLGNPPQILDIAIKDGKIHDIGEFNKDVSAREVYDVSGLAVAPGFIDVNNHSDTHWRIFSDPGLESLLYQGITTIVGGTCGSSLAPLIKDEAINSIRKWTDIRRSNLNWESVGDFFVHLSSRGIPLNFGTLVGHSTIRRALVGDEHRSYSDDELKYAIFSLKESMKQGALGMSLGLAYTHAKAANEKELQSMIEQVGVSKGIISVHMRNEDVNVMFSLKEVLQYAEKKKTPLHISHLKIMGEKNWGGFDSLLSEIDYATRKNIPISFDVFPYAFTGSVLYTLLPDWASEGGRDAMLSRLKDQLVRRQIISEMKKTGIDYKNVHVLSATFLDKSMTKKSIAEIAKIRGISPEEAILDVLVSSEIRAIARMDVLNEEDVRKAMKHPLSIIATDGSGYSLKHKKIGEDIHPRCFGAFPRFLGRYVRDEGLLSMEEAIRKITGYPAQRFGLQNRGVLKEGNYADITVFDPKKIQEKATIGNPYKYARGVEFVVINGEVVLKEGKVSGKNSGMVLRKK
jgi:N-acyl-D-amino-acid deacylase